MLLLGGCASDIAEPTNSDLLADEVNAFLQDAPIEVLLQAPDETQPFPSSIVELPHGQIQITARLPPDEAATPELLEELDTTGGTLRIATEAIARMDGMRGVEPVPVELAEAAEWIVNGQSMCGTEKLSAYAEVDINGRRLHVLLGFHLLNIGVPGEEQDYLAPWNPTDCDSYWNAVPFYRFFAHDCGGDACTIMVPNTGSGSSSGSGTVAIDPDGTITVGGSGSGSTGHEGPFVPLAGSCQWTNYSTFSGCGCVVSYVNPSD